MAKYMPRPGAYPFSIEYPQGWHVDDAQPNQVIFYQDDEAEGSSFAIVASALQGQLGAKDVLIAIGQYLQQQYPDLRIRVLVVRNVPAAGAQFQVLDAEATWTGARQQPMRALLQLRTVTAPGTAITSFFYLAGQAPAQAFDALRPAYARMIKSFTF